jgi:hypothetical protein
MMDWFIHFAGVMWETCLDMLPIATLIIVFQLWVIKKPLPHPKRTLIGFAYVSLGIAFFLEGLDMALFPIGKLLVAELTSVEFMGIHPQNYVLTWRDYGWVYLFAASIGFATTLAEPSLLTIAIKAEQISGGAMKAWGLRIAVSLGVAVGIALGAFRIVTGIELSTFIIIGYVLVLIQTLFAPKFIVSLAYDSGGVTTSTVTVPLVMTLGVGLAQVIPDRNPLVDGFGLIAFASLFPITTVLGYAQIAAWRASKQ